MQRGIKAALIAALAIAVCIFCAYTFIVPEYTVSFFSGDELLASQDVKYGSRPEVFAPEMEGCVFTGWTDGSGSAADPFGGRVTAGAEYHAGWRVELTEHEPYLFTDENGLIRPDDVMTGSELRAALEALAPDGAEQFLPEIPGGELTGEAFAAVLDELFPGEGSALTLSGSVTRGEAAAALNSLLGRGRGEGSAVADGALLPPDAWTEDVREACIPHSEGGGSWTDASVAPAFDEGFAHIGGDLCYVQADGLFLRDGDVGTLHFGPDGRYTSGSAELDGYTRELAAQFIAADPGGDALGWLRAAYDYTRDSFSYLRRNYYLFGETGWETDEALTMFETGRGNCYCYAAVFWSLARQLGFEAEAVSGTISKTNQPHAWVEIAVDGTNYYFDPETEMAYIADRDYGYDMFMMNRYYAQTWSYRG